jgi:AhpD family alkylhydroperoxidase
MDERTKELIAIGASVGAHCQPCLTYHVGEARELGIGEDAIGEAIEVGFMVEKGAFAAMKQHARLVLDNQAETPGGACCPDGDTPCCGDRKGE